MRKGTLRGALVTGLVLVAALAAPGCNLSPERECEPNEEHCAGDIAFQCDEYQGHTGNGSRWRRVACAGPDYCHEYENRAFCTVDPGTTAECEQQTYCDGSDLYLCRGPYSFARTYCENCSATEPCQNGLNTRCTPGSCPTGLECGFNRFCVAPCSCPEGEPCQSCDQWGANGDSEWVCVAGICTERPR